MLQSSILKWLAFVIVYLSYSSVDVEPLVHYYFAMVRAFWLSVYKCLAEFGKGISQDKDIFLTISWLIHLVKSTKRRSSGPLAMMDLHKDLWPLHIMDNL